MPAPKAVLLDVGGIFHLPSHDRIVAAFERAQVTVTADVLDRAHYAGAARFIVGDLEPDWKTRWRAYLEGYISACGVGDDPSIREEVHTHLDSEFAVGDLWSRVIPRSVVRITPAMGGGVYEPSRVVGQDHAHTDGPEQAR